MNSSARSALAANTIIATTTSSSSSSSTSGSSSNSYGRSSTTSTRSTNSRPYFFESSIADELYWSDDDEPFMNPSSQQQNRNNQDSSKKEKLQDQPKDYHVKLSHETNPRADFRKKGICQGWNRDLIPPGDNNNNVNKSKKRNKQKLPIVPICANCLSPLILNAPPTKNVPIEIEQEEQKQPSEQRKLFHHNHRPWALACCHVVCSKCIMEAKCRFFKQKGISTNPRLDFNAFRVARFSSKYTTTSKDAIPVDISSRQDPQTNNYWTICPVIACSKDKDALQDDSLNNAWELVV